VRAVLEKCAGTALNSKLIASQRGLFAPMIVDAVSLLDERLADIKMVGIKKVGARARPSAVSSPAAAAHACACCCTAFSPAAAAARACVHARPRGACAGAAQSRSDLRG
jgi:hypothetical protein